MPDRRVSVGIDADISGFQRGLATAAVEAKAFSRELESADGRMANLIQTGLALAPALVPLGAAAVPAVAGLTLQLGLAAGAAGVAVLAFHGVGDSLKALDAYQLAPTAENFAKLNATLDKLGPAGQEFVLALDKMKPQLQGLQDVAEAGLLPGVTDGLESFIKLGPQVKEVIFTIASTLGDLSREAGAGLSSAGLQKFFTYIETTARPVLTEMGKTLGNFVEGLANVIVAFDPLSRSFSTGLLNISRAFKDATANLDASTGFQDFVDYIQKSGPRALDALESLGNAFVQLVEAAAPVGSAVLPVISELADGLASIANSPVGPLLIGTAAAVGTLGRSLALLKAVGLRGGGDSLIGRILDPGKIRAGALAFASVPTAADRARLSIVELDAAEKKRNATVRAGAVQFGKNAALVGGLALATTGLADKTGLSNTASLALAGTIAGPWGAALGAGVGAVLDLRDSTKETADAIRLLDRAAGGGSYVQMLQARSAAEETYKQKNKITFGSIAKVGLTLGNDTFLANGSDPGGTAALAAKLKSASVQIAQTTSAYRGLADLLGQRLPADASPQQIQDFADKVAPALQKAGISIKDLTSGGFSDLTQAAGAVRSYFAEFDSASGKSKAVGAALADLGGQMESNVTQAQALGNALDSLFGVELSQSAATDAAIVALKALGAALRATKGDLLGNGDASLKARDATRGYISAQLDKVKADAAADGSGRRAAETLLQTRNNIVATARAAGASKADIKALVAQMGLTPANLKTIITTPGLLTAKEQVKALSRLLGLTPAEVRAKFKIDGADKAIGQTTSLQHLLNDLNGTVATTTIKTVHTSTGTDGTGGGYAPKKKATGGLLDGPGTKTSDSIPLLASRGEYVIQAAAVDYYGPGFFDAANAQRLAGGGLVGSAPGQEAADAQLEILQQQQQIRQLVADMNEKVHKGKRKGQYVITGADRVEKQAEIDSANLQLDYLLHKAQYDQNAQDAQDKLDAAQAISDAASQRAATIQQTSQSLFGTASLFSRGTSATAISASASRFEQDVNDYATALQSLIDAGAGYGILVNVEQIADQGDFRTAAKVARNLAANPLIVGGINSTLARVQVKTQAIAALTTGSAFQLGYIGATQGSGGVTVPVNFMQDPSDLASYIARVVTHEVTTTIAQVGSQP